MQNYAVNITKWIQSTYTHGVRAARTSTLKNDCEAYNKWHTRMRNDCRILFEQLYPAKSETKRQRWAFVRLDTETHDIRMCHFGYKSAENWKNVRILFLILCEALFLVWQTITRFFRADMKCKDEAECVYPYIKRENVFAELMMCAENRSLDPAPAHEYE